jgi:hypothetical protein
MFNVLGGIQVRCLVPLFPQLNFPRFKHFSPKRISRFLERVLVQVLAQRTRNSKDFEMGAKFRKVSEFLCDTT